MALRIFKYPLKTTDEQVIEIPNGAKILTIQVQKKFMSGTDHTSEQVCIWAMINEQSGMGRKKIVMFGTGHPIDSNKNLEYIGSFQIHNGEQIYHAFEEK